MPITNTHPEYDRYIGAVVKTRDALEGDVVDYVPKKESQNLTQYEVFRSRPSYYNVVERTTTALVGALTRKPMMVEGVYNDVPVISGGDSPEELVQQSYVELLTGGRVGLLCDYNEDKQSPEIVMYRSEDIINWCQYFVVLKEHYYGHDKDDPYKIVMRCKYRELYLDEQGFYAVHVWEETSKNVWEVTDDPVPTVRGARLQEIPFVFVNPYDTKPGMCKPPLMTLANINIEHFTLQAQMAHVTWVLSFPLPTIIGDLQDDTTQVGFGGDRFLHLTKDSDAKFLEFTGAGANTIKEQIVNKEQQMFSMGSRLLQYKSGVESSDALQIRLGAEGASLVTMANSLQAGLTKVLQYYNQWWNADPAAVVVSLNKDFTPAVMTPDQIQILIELYTKNVITLDTLMKRLYDGEIVDSVEEELQAVAGDQVLAQPAQ